MLNAVSKRPLHSHLRFSTIRGRVSSRASDAGDANKFKAMRRVFQETFANLPGWKAKGGSFGFTREIIKSRAFGLNSYIRRRLPPFKVDVSIGKVGDVTYEIQATALSGEGCHRNFNDGRELMLAFTGVARNMLNIPQPYPEVVLRKRHELQQFFDSDMYWLRRSPDKEVVAAGLFHETEPVIPHAEYTRAGSIFSRALSFGAVEEIRFGHAPIASPETNNDPICKFWFSYRTMPEHMRHFNSQLRIFDLLLTNEIDREPASAS